MQTRAILTTAALALAICGGRTQQLSGSDSIIIHFTEVDRYAVSVMPCTKAGPKVAVALPYKNLSQSKVDAVVTEGVHLHRPVRVMDGQRVVAECRLVGEFIYSVGVIGRPADREKEYGLLVVFDTPEEAQRIASVLRLKPSLDDLIRQHKKELDDQRYWRVLTHSTALEPL